MTFSDRLLVFSFCFRRWLPVRIRWCLLFLVLTPKVLWLFLSEKNMQVAKWIELGGIVSQFLGRAINDLVPQVRDWNDKYNGDATGASLSAEDLQDIRLRHQELMSRYHTLSAAEVEELREINGILSQIPSNPQGMSSSVPSGGEMFPHQTPETFQ